MNNTLKQKGLTLQDEGMTTINRLFHIASMSDSSEMDRFLDDMVSEIFIHLCHLLPKENMIVMEVH